MIVNSSGSNSLLWKMRSIKASADLIAHSENILEYEAMMPSTEKNMSSCLLLPSLFHRCNSLSETAHKPCTLGFYKHHFLIPLEHHLITCSCCTGARYGSALLDFCQSFSLQHVLSSSVALKTNKQKKPTNPPHPKSIAYITSNKEQKLDPSNNLHIGLYSESECMQLGKWDSGKIFQSTPLQVYFDFEVAKLLVFC